MNSTSVTVVTFKIAAETTGKEFTPIIGILFFAIALLCAILICSPEICACLRSNREGPITLTPVIPFPQDNLQVFKGTDDFKNVVPEAKIQVYNRKAETRNNLESDVLKNEDLAMNQINEFMASVFKLYDRVPHEHEAVRTERGEKCFRLKPKMYVPVNARTISIKMNGYEHGEKCHDFVPIGGAAPGSHFTYQVYGDNRIQVTRYVVDGKSEIGGFCIYIQHPWLSKLEYRWDLLNDLAKFATTSTMSGTVRSVEITGNPQVTEERRNETIQQKIEVVPEETTKLLSQESSEDDREWTVKYCSKRRRKVMTSVDSGEIVVHQEWFERSNQTKIEKCEECTKEGLEKEEQPPSYSSIFVV